MKKIALLLVICLSLGLFTSCNLWGDVHEYGIIYGTTYEIKLKGENANDAYQDIKAMIEEIELLLSASIESSDIYRINHSELHSPIEISDLAIEMFKMSKEAYKLTDGAFNAAIYPLVELWGFSHSSNFQENEPPEISEINALIEYCSFDYFELDEENKTITRLSDKAKLDLGGIAKGYAVQKAIDIANSYEIKSAIINIGGNVGIIGDTIKVGIKSPRNSDEVFCSFDMDNAYSVATSGDYERYYIYEETRYHHIIDPVTGAPADNGVIGVSIVSNNGAMTDIFSTAIFVMGKEEGLIFAEDNNIQCVIITNDNKYYTTMDVELLEEEYERGN